MSEPESGAILDHLPQKLPPGTRKYHLNLSSVLDTTNGAPGIDSEPTRQQPTTSSAQELADISKFVEVYGTEKFKAFIRAWDFDSGIRTAYKRILAVTHLVFVLDVVTAVAGFMSSITYVMSTYPQFDDNSSLDSIDNLLTIYFICDYVGRIMVGGISYAKSWFGILDFLTILPILATADPENPAAPTLFLRFARSNLTLLRLVRAMRFLKVLRALRLWKFHRVISLSDHSVLNATVALIMTVISVITVASGLFLLTEKDLGPMHDLRFHDAFYFVATTIATIGYGDIVPVTVAGKFLVIATIALALVLIPVQSAKILELTNNIKLSDGVFVPTAGTSHVLCVVPTGYSSAQLQEFLGCLFHSNFRDTTVAMNVVVISQNNSCENLHQDIRSLSFSKHVFFINGSVHESHDLDRAALSSASAVFILSRRMSASQEEMDSRDDNAFLSAISLKNHSPSVPTIIQINSMRSQSHVLFKTLSHFPNIQCLCMRQKSMSVMAQSCVVPGLHTLVGNLVQSFDQEDLNTAVIRQSGTKPSLLRRAMSSKHIQTEHSHDGIWWLEYSAGGTYQTFPSVISHFFHGWTFGETTLELASHTGVLLFAMADITSEGNVEICLNPSDRVVHEGELIYVMARNAHEAAGVALFTNDGYVSPHRIRTMKRRLSFTFGEHHTSRDAGMIPIRSRELVTLPMAFQMSLVAPTPNSVIGNNEIHRIISESQSHIREIPVIDNASEFKGHIIVSGHIDDSIMEFVRSLRMQNWELISPPIIIVQPKVLPPAVSRGLLSFKNVFQLIGSMSVRADLIRLRVLEANACVLLSSPFRPAGFDVDGDSRRHEIRADCPTIFDTLALENYIALVKERDNSNTIIELCFTSNIRFLRPAFTRSGSNPIDFIPSLAEDDMFIRMPPLATADGKILGSGMQETVTAGSFFNPHLINIVEAFINGTSVRIKNQPGRMRILLVRMPLNLQGQNIKYSVVMQYFVSRLSYLPIGLFRTRYENSAPIPFVFTNPPMSTLVRMTDLLYVMAPVISSMVDNVAYTSLHHPAGPDVPHIKIVTSLFTTDAPGCGSKVLQSPAFVRVPDHKGKGHIGNQERVLNIATSEFLKYKRRSVSYARKQDVQS